MSATEQFVRELDSWVGTPRYHCGAVAGPPRAVKGERGDCVHVIAAALVNAGLLASLTIPAYPAHAGEHKHTALASVLRSLVERRLATRIPEGEIARGDLLVFGASHAHHLGVLKELPSGAFYHCGAEHFMVSWLREAQYRTMFRSAYRIGGAPR